MDLKVRELLEEFEKKYDSTRNNFIECTVSCIKDVINNIHEDKLVLLDATGFLKDIGTDAVSLTFFKPMSVATGGSYLTDVVDIFIRLPKKCFLDEDDPFYLNHLYHAKRCLYLLAIKQALEVSGKFKKIEWSPFQNEARKPVLLLYPDHGDICPFHIRLIPTATSFSKVWKLKLTRNNLPAGVSQATPVYNSSILEDMFLEENAEFVRKTFLDWKELGRALILMKEWARNRPSIYAHDCLDEFLISVILSYLANECGGHLINRSMKAMQIFRVTLRFIATSKLWDKGIYLQPHSQSSLSEEERKQYRQSFPVLICDSSSHFNLASRFTNSSLLELRDEAALTINCIDKNKDGGFEEVFMINVDFPAKYDYCIRIINLEGNKAVYPSGFCLDKECWRTYVEDVLLAIKEGLGDKAKSIRVTWKIGPSEWNIEEGFSKFGCDPLLIGISISHLESTVLGCKQWERHLNVKKIIEDVLVRRLSLKKKDMIPFADQLDFCLPDGGEDSIKIYGTLLAALEVLSKSLHALKDNNFRVSSVQPLDSAFWSTSVFLPKPDSSAEKKDEAQRPPQPLEIIIQVEDLGNCSMDNVAIEKAKSAFLSKIEESQGMTYTAAKDAVDVTVSGYAFRLIILHESGQSFVKNQDKKKVFIRGQHSRMIIGLLGRYPIYGPVVRLAKRWISALFFSAILADEAVELLVAYLFLRPLPFYAPCSPITGFLRFLRILSNYNWNSSPLIIDINGEMTLEDEKEVNENFMSIRRPSEENPQNLDCSMSSEENPQNLDCSMSSEENPQNLDCSMFLATSYDKTSEAWTKSSPIKFDLERIIARAQSSAKLLTNLVLQDEKDSKTWKSLFSTRLDDYDVVVLLHQQNLPYRPLCQSEVNGTLPVTTMRAANKTFLDPVGCFVKGLEEEEFRGIFKLWYDSFGGDAIGLTWDGPVSKKRLMKEYKSLSLKRMLKNVAEIGDGFVKSVYLIKQPEYMD